MNNDKYYNDCLNSLNDCRKSSEDDFENKITYITAGALGLSITFFKDYNLHNFSWVLLGSWWLLTISLLLNCWSALHIKSMCIRVSTEIKRTEPKEQKKDFTPQVTKITRISDWYNWITIFSSMIGIMAVVLFATLNFTNMKKENNQQEGVVEHNDWSDTVHVRAQVVEIQSSRGVDAPMWPSSSKDDDGGEKGDNIIKRPE